MKTEKKIRYAVVGLGYISQIAMLPAFAHAQKNSTLSALVSGEPKKLKKLSRQYDVPLACNYGDYEQLLESGEIDAVYLALPNSLHEDYAIKAAQAGIHVLCEKPLATTVTACEKIIQTAARHGALLMVAYRLHFEQANLKAIELARSGQLGDLRIFHSLFTMQVKAGNVRLKRELGGGSLFDLGVYCINAARGLFRAEPDAVLALSVGETDQRFREVDEMTGALLHFPGGRLASFVSSFGAADASCFDILGTSGSLRVDPAYEMVGELKHSLKLQGKTKQLSFGKRDQFAPELIYFSDCILKGRKPEPSGEEGLADVRVIEALYRSARSGKTVRLPPLTKQRRARASQGIFRPAVPKPKLILADSPSQED